MTISGRDWYNCAKLFYIFNQKLENLNRSFFTEICGAYLEKRNMQNTSEMHNKASKLTSIESANVKDSISFIINENSESLKGPEEEKKPIKKSLESEASLLNSQIGTVSNHLKNKSKETESALNALDTLRNKTTEILSRLNNPELEIEFRATCSAIQTSSSFCDPQLMQAYQDYIKAYQQKTSLYNITWDYKNKRAHLVIYNTEAEREEEAKTLQTPLHLSPETRIVQLPNGKLFCFGELSWSSFGITVLIDVNGIYFNNSVYCFGGKGKNYLTLSSRFDLDQNRWIQLTTMPEADWYDSIIFNGSILISGEYRNLLLYSIDIDSFSTIPYEFAQYKRKILINVERLYLIECSHGSIYESEIGSYSNWIWICHSIFLRSPYQVYCSYNKGGIYIAHSDHFENKNYVTVYKFNLEAKIFAKIL